MEGANFAGPGLPGDFVLPRNSRFSAVCFNVSVLLVGFMGTKEILFRADIRGARIAPVSALKDLKVHKI